MLDLFTFSVGYHNLRVDDHAEPVAELRRIYDFVLQHSLMIERGYRPEGLRLFSRVKWICPIAGTE